MPALISFSDDSEPSSPPPGAPPAHPPSAAASANAAKATSRPLKRAAPRFLGDEDDEDAPTSRNSLPKGGRLTSKFRTTAADVDRLFANIEASDNDDEDGLPPPLQRGTQGSIIDDSINALGGARKGKKTKGGDGDDDLDDKIDADGEKKRKAPRKRALMNEERLRGERGFKKLKESLKGFKSKGKGHEAEDLRRLMTVYQLWAHQMFPKGNFLDTIERVEKLTSKKAIKYELTVWRKEAKGIFDPKPEDSEADVDMDAALDVEAAEIDGAQAATTSQAGSPDPARPKKSYFDDIPTSSPGGALERDLEMGEDGDMDEVEDALFGPASQAALQSEADLFGPAAGTSAGRPRAPTQGATSEAGFNDADLEGMGFDFDDGPDDFDMDAEAEAAMREMEAMENEPRESDMVRAARAREARAARAREASRASTVAPQKEHRPISFYADATAKSKPAMDAKKAAAAQEEEDNFDDFDFGDEEEMMRDMAQAEAAAEKRLQAEAALQQIEAPKAGDISKTPSLSTGTDSFDLDDDLEEDAEFLKSIEEAEKAEAASKHPEAPVAVAKGIPPAFQQTVFEEDEDLYS